MGVGFESGLHTVGVVMAIEKQWCNICEHRHNLNEDHVFSGGKKTARKKRAGKVAATEEGDISFAGKIIAERWSPEERREMGLPAEQDWLEPIPGCRCSQCKHVWVPISDRKPKRCPSCMSRAWSA